MWKNNSLSFVLFVLFVVSLIGHSIAGWKVYNEEERQHGKPAVTYAELLTTSEFGETVFQNSQSEFLAVLAIVVPPIWLRQWGSPESKPVHASHSDTGGG